MFLDFLFLIYILMKRSVYNFKNFLLLEAIKNVNKVIKDLNIDPQDSDLLKIKDLLKKNPNLIGTFLEFRFKEGFPIENIIDRIQWVLKYPQNVKKLPKNLVNYNSFEELEDDITHLNNDIKINDFYKSLYKQTRENIFRLSEEDKKELDLIVSQFMSLSEEKRKEFTPLKYFKMNNVSTSEFTKALKEFVESGSLSFNKESILEQLESCENYDILVNKDNILLIRSNNINTVRKMGSNKWCIVYDTSNYYADRYFGIDTFNTQFILFNFNLPEYMSNSQFGITLNKDGESIDGGCQNKLNQSVPFEDILEMTGLSRSDFKLDLERYNRYKDYLGNLNKYVEASDIDGLIRFINSNTEFTYDLKSVFRKLNKNEIIIFQEILSKKNYTNPIIELTMEYSNVLEQLFTYYNFRGLFKFESNIDVITLEYITHYCGIYSKDIFGSTTYSIKNDGNEYESFISDFENLKEILNKYNVFKPKLYNTYKNNVIKNIRNEIINKPNYFKDFKDLMTALDKFVYSNVLGSDAEDGNVIEYINDEISTLFSYFKEDEHFIKIFKENISNFDVKEILEDNDTYYHTSSKTLFELFSSIDINDSDFNDNNVIKYVFESNGVKCDYMKSIKCVYDEEEQAYCIMFGDWDKLDDDYFDFSGGYNMSNLHEMFEHWNDYYPDLDSILDNTSYKFHLVTFKHIMDNEDNIKDEIEDDDNIIYDIDNHKETYEKYKEFKNDELKELYREDQNLKSLINFVSDVVSDEDIMNILDDTLGSTLRSIYSTADNQAMENKLFKELIEEFVDKFNLKYFSDGKAYKRTDDSKLLFKIGDFYGMEDDSYLYDLCYGYGQNFDIYDIFKVIVENKGLISIPDVSYADWGEVVQDIEFDMMEF